MVMLDPDTTGCASAWLNKDSRLDAKSRTTLASFLNGLDFVLAYSPTHTKPATTATFATSPA